MPLFSFAFFVTVCLPYFTALILTITMEQLGFPSVDNLVESLKTEMLAGLDIIIKALIPALGIALIIRKLTS